ncbi:MAG: adenine deaminase [Schwartzia sp.]|nr:adenine deaminase [Schwartzia sp. (in: firmicutes)]
MPSIMTEKEALRRQIGAAAGRETADLVIRNCRIVNVFTGEIESGEIAVVDGVIVGTDAGCEGRVTIDAEGRYAAPGFIDAHIHIESSYVSPEQAGRMLVPHGAATIIADPHEIANVCGLDGLRYMLEAAKGTKLNIIYAMPSCVPATAFEDAGAKLDAEDMKELLADERIFGLGEFMNMPGVIRADDAALDKLTLARSMGKIVDGHAPGLSGKDLNAYASAGILGDHECRTPEEIRERISKGMYALLREGSACHDLRALLKGVTEASSRRAMFCSDDRQPKTVFAEGHIDHHLRICVEEGFDPVTAVRMATLNAAEAFRLYDRGAIAPGRRADVVLLDDLKDFHVHRVFIGGELVAEEGRYLPELTFADISTVRGSVNIRNFSADRFKLKLAGNKARVIGVQKGSIVTTKETATVQTDGDGDFVFDPRLDVCKLAVVERHHGTGQVGVGLLGGYGIKAGAVAVSVAHDSHNIIVAGVSNEEMAFAVKALISMEGGMVVVKGGEVLAAMALPIAGLMTTESGEWVADRLETLHKKALELGVSTDVEPIMTLTFMALPVIPALKLTARGLFDYEKFDFIPPEA